MCGQSTGQNWQDLLSGSELRSGSVSSNERESSLERERKGGRSLMKQPNGSIVDLPKKSPFSSVFLELGHGYIRYHLYPGIPSYREVLISKQCDQKVMGGGSLMKQLLLGKITYGDQLGVWCWCLLAFTEVEYSSSVADSCSGHHWVSSSSSASASASPPSGKPSNKQTNEQTHKRTDAQTESEFQLVPWMFW